MGFYDDEFLKTDEFVRLPVDWPPGEFNYLYWKKLSSATPYKAKEAKASTLHDVNHRVIHWIITHSVNGKGQSTGVVGTYELLYLHSIIERHPLNLGVMLAFFFHRQAKTNKAKGTIYCGAYITRLLKGLQIFPAEEPKDIVACSHIIEPSTLQKWFKQPEASTSMSSPPNRSPYDVLTKKVEKNRRILQKMKSLFKALIRTTKRQTRHQEAIYSCLKGIAAKNNVEFSPPHAGPSESFPSSPDDVQVDNFQTLLEDSDDAEIDAQIRASQEHITDEASEEEVDDDDEDDGSEEEEDTPTPTPGPSSSKKKRSRKSDDDDPDYQGD